MEKKGLDINFFIGMILIFVLVMWFTYDTMDTQAPNQQTSDQEITIPDTDIESNNTNFIEETELEKEEYDNNNSIDIPEEEYSLSNDHLDILFSNYGATIQEVTLKNYLTHDGSPLKLIAGEVNFNIGLQSIYRQKKRQTPQVNTSELLFTHNDIKSSDTKLVFSGRDHSTNNTINVIYELLDDYQLTVDISITSNDSEQLIQPVNFVFSQKINQLEKNINNERNATTIKHSEGELNPRKLDSETVNGVSWFSHSQQFFSTIIASETAFKSSSFEADFPENSDSHIKTLTSNCEFKDDNKNSISLNFYFVPNQYSLLKSFDQDFESIVSLGWFGFVNKWLVIPMFNWLDNMGLNYGLIIFIIALVIKMILYLPTKSSYLSMAKMRVLKPEIDAINDTIKDPMKRQQAQMDLYKKTGVNPLGGCLPLLFQMPILIALFSFFPAAFELRQEGFLWADDLSTYDSVLEFTGIPAIGFDHLSLFALLMSLATLIQMKFNTQSTNTQMPQMKYIMYIMPVVFFFVMNSYCAALSYYYFLANLITFTQQMIIRRNIDDKKLYAMLQENKKKPIKKSKFQKKLEDMAKKNQNR